MRKSRFTDEEGTVALAGPRKPDEQIIGMIKEQEAGLPTSELCRKDGLRPATFCKSKARYGWLGLSGATRLKQLEDEHAKLKRLLADAMPDNVVLKDLPEKP